MTYAKRTVSNIAVLNGKCATVSDDSRSSWPVNIYSHAAPMSRFAANVQCEAKTTRADPLVDRIESPHSPTKSTTSKLRVSFVPAILDGCPSYQLGETCSGPR